MLYLSERFLKRMDQKSISFLQMKYTKLNESILLDL